MFWLWFCLAVYVIVCIGIYGVFRSGRNSSLSREDARHRNGVVMLLTLLWPLILIVTLIEFCISRGLD